MKSEKSVKSKSAQHTKPAENTEKSVKTKEKSTKTKEKSPHHASRYFIIGLLLTVFNYGIYTILANFIIKNNDFLWLSTLISTFITTIAAYLAHSKITWKDREITKSAIYKFFIWNFLAAFAINPILTQAFGLLTPVYDLAYNICQNLHIDFTYDFIQSTGAFVFTGVVNMILNYLFYDKFVFGDTKLDFEILFQVKAGPSEDKKPKSSKDHKNHEARKNSENSKDAKDDEEDGL